MILNVFVEFWCWYSPLFSDPDNKVRLAVWASTLATATFIISFIYKPSREFCLNRFNKNSKAVKKLKEDFLFDTSSLPNLLQKQVESIDSFLEKVRAEKPEIGCEIIYNLKVLQEQFSNYKREELFDAFGRKNENKKAITNILRNVDFINQLILGIEKELPIFPSIVNEQRLVYSGILQEIFTMAQSDTVLINNGKMETSFIPFAIEIVGVCNEHAKVANEYRLLFGKESFFTPLRKVLQKYGNVNPKAVKLTEMTNKADEAYKQVGLAQRNVIRFFERTKDQFSKTAESIESQKMILKQ